MILKTANSNIVVMMHSLNDFLSKGMEIFDCNTCIGLPYVPSLPVEAKEAVFFDLGDGRIDFNGLFREFIAIEEERGDEITIVLENEGSAGAGY